MAEAPRIRPSAAWYALAAPVFALGVGLALHTLIHGLLHIPDRLTQVVVPGSREFSFQRTIGYTVFLEEESVVDGTIYRTQGAPAGLACKVESLASGRVITPGGARESATYNFQGRSGRAVQSFSVPEDGRYRFTCSYASEQPGPQAVLAIGHGVGQEIVRIVFGCLTWGGAGVLLSTAIIVAVALARERSQKRLREATAGRT